MPTSSPGDRAGHRGRREPEQSLEAGRISKLRRRRWSSSPTACSRCQAPRATGPGQRHWAYPKDGLGRRDDRVAGGLCPRGRGRPRRFPGRRPARCHPDQVRRRRHRGRQTATLNLATGAGTMAVSGPPSGHAKITAAGDMRLGEIDGEAQIKNLNGKTWVGEVTGPLASSRRTATSRSTRRMGRGRR